MNLQVQALLEVEYPNYGTMAPRKQRMGLQEFKVKLLRKTNELYSNARKEGRDLTDEETVVVEANHEIVLSLLEADNELANQLEAAADVTPLQSHPGGAGGEGPVFAMENGQEIRALLPSERLADRFPAAADHASLGQMVRARITGEEIGASALQAASGEGVGSLGGFFLAQPVAAGVIDLARNASVLVRGGAITIPMADSQMTIVRQLTDITGKWRAEHVKITESEPTFEPIRLKAVALAAIARISIELMEDAPQFGQLIETAIGAALALEMDRAGIFGTGSGEPRGVTNTPGVNEVSMGTNGAAFVNYDKFLDAIETIETANGSARSVAYAPRTKRGLAGLKTGISGDQTPLMAPQDFLDLARFTSNQFPITETQGSATNASTALLGDFSQIAFGLRTGLRIEATRWGDESAFSQMEVLIRGYLRVDVAVLRPSHLTKIIGIKP